MKHAPRNQLPKALRRARKALGLSQESFAGVSGRTYLSQLERGERRATLAKLDDLAAVLGIHPATLVALSYLPESASAAEAEKLLGRMRTEMDRVMTASGFLGGPGADRADNGAVDSVVLGLRPWLDLMSTTAALKSELLTR